MSNNPIQDKFIKNTLYIVLGVLLMIFIVIQPYNLFCKIKKTCQPVSFTSLIPKKTGQQKITFIFEANIPDDLKEEVEFEPVKPELNVQNGRNIINAYEVKNLTDENIVAGAHFQIEPREVNKYLERVQCICFNKQPLNAGEEAKMPVNLRINPEIEQDAELKNLKEVKISYEVYLE